MTYKFSGHETFPCRYAWLPKAVGALQADSLLFSDPDSAMVVLGVGKNMVRSIRFWVEATKMAQPDGKGQLVVRPFGEMLLGDYGHDPYLEDIQTLWLIHWNLSTRINDPIFAWDFLINRWHEPEILPSSVLKAFEKEAALQKRKLSKVTLKQHLDIFIHTYSPTRGKKGTVLEENLDSPLIELDLIRHIGERSINEQQDAKREPVYAFNREPKPSISQHLFVYCLNDFWNAHFADENTLAFRHVAYGHGSPGQVFKLPETEIFEYLTRIEFITNGSLSFQESAHLRQLRRHENLTWTDLLSSIYRAEVTNA
ncbi:DUF4007 family protein [Thermodesulfobacteriota bacterium]